MTICQLKLCHSKLIFILSNLAVVLVETTAIIYLDTKARLAFHLGIMSSKVFFLSFVVILFNVALGINEARIYSDSGT